MADANTPGTERIGPPAWSRRDVLALSAWTAAVCLYFAPVLAGQRVFFYFDITEINYPYRAFYANELKQGRFPLWCPHLYCGFPLFAESQAGQLYPLKYLLYPWMPPWLAFGYDAVLHVLLAGVAMYVYLRRRVGAAAALTGAAAFGYGGFLPAHVIHTSYLNSMMWIPLGLLALERLWQTARWKFGLLAAGCLAMQIFAGNMQIAILTFWAYGVLAVFWAATALRDGRAGTALGVLGTTAGTLVLAAAIGAVQFVPSLRLLELSPRQQGLKYDELMFASWHPELLPTLFLPHAYGSRSHDTDWIDGYYPYHEMHVYLGVVTLLLAAIGGAGVRDRWLFSHVVLTVVALLLMLGRYGVLYDACQYFPVLRGMRFPVRLSLWWSLSLGTLAAWGVERLRVEGVRLRGPLLAFAGAAAVALLILAVLYHPYWMNQEEATRVARRPENRARQARLIKQIASDAASAAVLTALALAAIALARRPWETNRGTGNEGHSSPEDTLAATARAARRNNARSPALATASPWIAALPLLVIADLFWSQRDLNPTIEHSYWSEPPKVLELFRDEPELFRIHTYDHGDVTYPRRELGRLAHNDPGYLADPEAFRLASQWLPMSVPAAWGVDSRRGHTPIFPARVKQFLDIAQIWTLDIANVKYVVSDTPLPGRLGTYPQLMTDPCFVYRNPHVLPRVRLMEEVRFVRNADEAVALLSQPRFPVRDALVLEDPERAGQERTADNPDQQEESGDSESAAVQGSGAVGTVEVVTYEPDRVVFDVTAARSCFLFLADTYYPQWEASLDGNPTNILPANVAFRAVEVPAGTHRLVFRYRGQSFRTGLAISLAALLAAASLAFLFRRVSPPKLRLHEPLRDSRKAMVCLGLAVALALVVSVAVKRKEWFDIGDNSVRPVLHYYQWERVP